MYKVAIAITATRSDINNQFKGVITFKDEKNQATSFDYVCTNPKNEYVDIEYSGTNENFQIKGLPTKELIDGLKENQKLIFCLSIGLLVSVLDNAERFSLSHKSTQLMRQYGADASSMMEQTVEIEEDGYQYLFDKITKSAVKS
jgi:hypothetical protein